MVFPRRTPRSLLGPHRRRPVGEGQRMKFHANPKRERGNAVTRFVRFGLVCLLAALLGSPAHGQTSDDWPLEQLMLKGAKQYRGLLLDKTERQLEFAEIVRPRGKPMYAIIHAFAASEVSTYEPVSAD